jgi:serine protease inhibitor
MSKKKITTPVSLLVLSALAGWVIGSPQDVPDEMAQPIVDAGPIVKSSRQITASLMKKLQSRNPPSNFTMSPWSLTQGLEMLRFGATGETEAELRKFLHASGDAKSAFAESVRVQEALSYSIQQGIFRSANGVWVASGFAVNPDYLAGVSRGLGVKVKQSTFPNPALAEINQFVSETTRGRIPKLLDQLTSLTGLVLVNAVSFKDVWTLPFDVEKTKPGRFTTVTGKVVSTSMMSQRNHFMYTDAKTYQQIKFVYESGLIMSIVLPKAGVPVSNVLQVPLNHPQAKSEDVMVVIPKWKTESTFNLRNLMEAMGCGRVFDGGKAQLEGIAKGVSVSQATHKTFISVTEEGTEAAAATDISIAKSAPPRKINATFTADRPFAYYIHTCEGVVLFGGVVNDASR